MKIEGKIGSSLIIKNMRYGLGFLYNMHSLSLASSVISLLGAAGVIVVLRDGKARAFNNLPWFSGKDSVEEKVFLVPGLQNLGNNCFLNVILQALASCSSFQSFVRERVEELEMSSIEEKEENMPLAVSLDSLLEELCTPRYETEILSPRKVISAISYYNHGFDLTNQQDAEEAFFHILSSLREELADLYVFNQGSLADAACLINHRILGLEKRATQTELHRWKQYILGPFDGILKSILICHSCSNQISLDFHFFHSLHLSAMAGTSVEGCLKHFLAAEQLDDYFCSHCWHIAAVKYLSITNEFEADAVKVGNCSRHDSCDCRNLSILGALPWSNSYSRTVKQLNIVSSPKILCLHLQRVSPNLFGELLKFQGHISFPLTLDMSCLISSGDGSKSCKKDLPVGPSKPHFQHPFSFSRHLDMQLDTERINRKDGQTEKIPLVSEQKQAPSVVLEKKPVEANVEEMSVSGDCLEISSPDTNPVIQTDNKVSVVLPSEEVMIGQLDGKKIQDSQGQSSLSTIEGYPSSRADNTLLQSSNKMSGARHKAPAEQHMYRLASVVQHFGRAGGGHYTVYRRVSGKLRESDENQLPGSSSIQWFGISDSQVYRVSEEDVLAAEASLLFYEKIHTEV